MKAAYVLVALVALAAAVPALGETEKVKNYQQCGGLGGACTGKECKDDQWDDVECEEKGAKCIRNSAYSWMCAPSGSSVGGNPVEEDVEEINAMLSKEWTGPKTKLPNYQQCGGKAGCSDEGAVCADAAWPGFECEKGACTRNSEYNWQCKPANEGQATVLTDENGQAKVDVAEDGTIPRWKQCGGLTGLCGNYGKNGCRDCAFPGTKCEEGYVCTRVVEHFWQCAPEDMAQQGPQCEEEEEEEAGGAAGGAAGSRSVGWTDPKCGPKSEDYEVDGVYLDSLILASAAPFHECCGACQKSGDCVAFQVNMYGNGTDTCDMFSTINELVPATGTVAAVLPSTTGPLDTAGRK
jgi:hypothetical protein